MEANRKKGGEDPQNERGRFSFAKKRILATKEGSSMGWENRLQI